MYYVWNGWWWFAWLVPTLVILWVAFGWSGRRYGYGTYSGRHRYVYGDMDMDDVWGTRYKRSAARSHRNRGPRNYRRSEARIQEDVCDRLMLDDEIDASDMEVRVENGVVSLTGTVTTRSEKRMAEQIADSVAGVTDVDNQLKIGKRGAVSPPLSDRGKATATGPGNSSPS